MKLMNILIAADDEGKEDANCGDLDDGAEGFEVVEPNLLTNALGDKASFVVINGTVKIGFEVIHPLSADDMHMQVKRNQKPGSIVKQGTKLLSHSMMPMWMTKGIGEGMWFGREGYGCNRARG